MNNALMIDFSPLIPAATLYGLAALALLLLVLSFFFYKRGILWRALCIAAFILLFLNPSIVEEQREAVPDVVVVVADHSPSQAIGKRRERTDRALAYLKAEIENKTGMDLRVVEGESTSQEPARETRLFDQIDQALADVPLTRRAGVILLTDGQVHDVPQDQRRFGDYGPVHVLLSGDHEERDRQIVILEAPSYGIVGQEVTIRYRIEDTQQTRGENFSTLLVRQDDAKPVMELVPVNEDRTLTVKISHAGQNILDLEASGVDGELTMANNRVPLIINGVRDRLRVLLVSGEPHAGGRTWRNLLTSDPGVDLVHFTILREPEKLDATPQNELALIAFPFDELFDLKLYDFDLIIFDRYQLNRILPNYYFGNIARYIQEGGALLEASGPSFIGTNSIYETDLGRILPARPGANVFERAYKPSITATGMRHPVTQDLTWPGSEDGQPGWGSWLRQIDVTPIRGDIVMAGINDRPLLILDHVGKGRVAQLATDQIWLWSRGYEGGGPQAELLRRLAHWLMKEPELEENALNVTTNGSTLMIERRSLREDNMSVTVTAPDNKQSLVALTASPKGVLEGFYPADQLGVYTVNDGTQQRFALIGALNPPELSSVKTTEEKLNPLVHASRGQLMWLSDNEKPDIRLLPPERDYGGRGWLGLRTNKSYNVTGVKSIPILPEWLRLMTLLTLVIGAWWLEGRNRKRHL